ncbi:hypothetical protein C7401_15433 [Paraburkholderia unamae]|nr:hypothetical protein C7401_15433 [Paraburkholderia unamae]
MTPHRAHAFAQRKEYLAASRQILVTVFDDRQRRNVDLAAVLPEFAQARFRRRQFGLLRRECRALVRECLQIGPTGITLARIDDRNLDAVE